jgi:hypothetical protein
MLDALNDHKQVLSAIVFQDAPERYLDSCTSFLESAPERRYKTTGHFIGDNLRLAQSKQNAIIFVHNEIEEMLDIDTTDDMRTFARLRVVSPDYYIWPDRKEG